MTKKKLQSAFTDFQKGLLRLKEVLKMPDSQINQDASIQRFEFTFELAWKLMKAVAEFLGKGELAHNPRNAIRYAAQEGVISNPQTWFDFLEERNTTSHLYSQEAAKKIYRQIKKFPKVCDELEMNVKQYILS